MHITRVVIAAHRTLFRQGLTALIGSDAEFEICGEAADRDETRRVCARVHPEIILLESELLDAGKDCGMIPCLRVACPDADIVVISEMSHAMLKDEDAENHRAEKSRALQQGAAAWLPADIDQAELRRVLRTIASARQCGEEEGEGAQTAAKPALTAHSRHAVTERERMIIKLIAEGMCNKEVAHRLDISTQTVKNHVSHLLEKLALADRTQLAVYAIEHNFDF